MAANINQIYTSNPSTQLAPADLLYSGKSPYGALDNSAITMENFTHQIRGGAPIVSNSNSYTAINPVAAEYIMTPTTNLAAFYLPVMNTNDSMLAGGSFIIKNNSTFVMEVYLQDTTTLVVNLRASESIKLIVTSNATANGAFDVIHISNTAVSNYVVGSNQSNYQTIQSAIDQAVVDGASRTNLKVIQIQPGTYTENVILSDGIVLMGPEPYCWLATGYQGNNTATQSVKIIGNASVDTTGTSNQTYAAFINIWLSSTTGNTVSCIGNTTVNNQFIAFIGCLVDVAASNAYCLEINQQFVDIINSAFYDVTPDLSGQFFLNNTIAGTMFLSIEGSMIAASYGAAPIVLPASSITVLRVLNSTFYPLFDAQAAITTFTMRMTNSTYGNIGVPNTVPVINLGGFNNAVLVFDNCQITMSATQNFVSTTGNNSQTIVNNCSFGLLGFAGGTSDIIQGGRVVFTNSSVRGAVITNNYNRTDLITNGFTGSSVYELQAGSSPGAGSTSVIASIALNANEAITVTGMISGHDTTFVDACGGTFTATFSRDAGNIVTVGTPIIDINTTSTASFNISAVIPGTINISVTAAVGLPYYFVCNYKYQKVLLNT